MKKIIIFQLICLSFLFADTVTLKNGEVLQNVKVSQSGDKFEIELADGKVREVQKSQIKSIKKQKNKQRQSLSNKSVEKNFKNKIGMELVLIPSGEFSMGCSSEDDKCEKDESPAHIEKISKPFYIGVYEVTQGQWKKVMGNNPASFDKCGEDCPIENVSWAEIKLFLRKLNEMEGREKGKNKYRLPTEIEWEYAAKAGSNTRIYSGEMKLAGNCNSSELDAIGWYCGNSGVDYEGGYVCTTWKEKQYDSIKCGTHPVGKKNPNAFGLYDTLGNVWEWTENFYDKNTSLSNNYDPSNRLGSSYRIPRGGSWHSYAQYCRSSYRPGSPEDRGHLFGFRVVLSI